MCFRVFMETSKSQTGWKEKKHNKITLSGLKYNSTILLVGVRSGVQGGVKISQQIDL